MSILKPNPLKVVLLLLICTGIAAKNEVDIPNALPLPKSAYKDQQLKLNRAFDTNRTTRYDQKKNLILRQCGPEDESQDVEFYDGTLGPTIDFVMFEEPSTGILQWREDLNSDHNGLFNDPGNVSGEKWCSGTLIGEDLFLTAGHCFVAQDSVVWSFPKKDGRVLSSEDLVRLMQVNFNYQISRESGTLRPIQTFPVVEMVEFGLDSSLNEVDQLDYALLRLGVNEKSELPGTYFRAANFDASLDIVRHAEMLTIIQHPHKDPKKINAGSIIGFDNHYSTIMYSDIDTFSGSSGAGIIDQHGNLIGIHTNGGCRIAFPNDPNFSNFGISLYAISKNSSVID